MPEPSPVSAAPGSAPAREAAVVALALGGFLASLATLYASPIAGVTDLGCGLRVADCEEALGSAYAQIAGIPLGVAGGFYFALAGLLVAAGRRSGAPSLRWAATLALATGGLVSMALLGVLAFVIRAPCLWCLLTHACNLGAGALWWPSRVWGIGRAERTGLPGRVLPLVLIAGLLAAGLFQLYQARAARAGAEAREKTIW